MTDTDDVARVYLNQGVKEFCKKVHGIPRRNYLTLSPKFDIATNFAIQLTVVGGVNEMAATDIAALSPASQVGQSMYNIQQQQNQAQMRNDLQTAYPEMAAMDVWKNALGGPMGTTTTQSGGNNSNPWAQAIGGIGTGWALGNMFNLW